MAEGTGTGEGSGTGTGTGQGAGSGTGSGAPDYTKQIADLTAKNAELDKKIAELTKTPDPKDDPSLLDKVRKEREALDKKNSDTKALENALRFNMQSADFVKTNSSLLPKDIEDIFKAAEKENYATIIEKDSAVKSGIVQSFFSIQANVDLLTPGLKSSLDDYLKLTKNGKQEKAQEMYNAVFEPAFEMLKRIKKAEAISKGHGPSDDSDTAYKKKMTELSEKHYLGRK